LARSRVLHLLAGGADNPARECKRPADKGSLEEEQGMTADSTSPDMIVYELARRSRAALAEAA
jgi:hypothetical protein